MTRPAPTYCEYEGGKYEAIGFVYPAYWEAENLDKIDRNGFIIPPDVGIHKIGRFSTACWHGYRYGLLIDDGRLWIDKLVVMLHGDDKPWPVINGVEGVAEPYDWWSDNHTEPPDPVWSGLRLPTTYTGPLPLVGPSEGESGFYVPPKSEPVAHWGVPWPDHLQLQVDTMHGQLMRGFRKMEMGAEEALAAIGQMEGAFSERGGVASCSMREAAGNAKWLHPYRGLLDVRVEEGRVVSVVDRGEELRQIRMQLGDHIRVLHDKVIGMFEAGESVEAVVEAIGAARELVAKVHAAWGQR